MNPKDRMGAAKPNLSVLPFAPLLEAVPALYEGRRKYGPWNWRAEKVSESIYADAAIRHLMQFLAGEDVDPDSGVHHIAKAIAGLLVVRDAQLHGCSVDDRMVDQNLNIEGIMEQLATVNEKYPEPVESALPPRGEPKRQGCCQDPVEVPCEIKPTHEIYDVGTGKQVSYFKYSDTVAGDGSYEISEDDVGKPCLLRNGKWGKIVRWSKLPDLGTVDYPVAVRLEDGTEGGVMLSHSEEGYQYMSRRVIINDIVRVIHA